MSTGIIKVRLTDRQKEIVQKMREGWVLKRFIRYWYLESENGSKSVNGNSAFFLMRKQIIEGREAATQEKHFHLTELGETVDVEQS